MVGEVYCFFLVLDMVVGGDDVGVGVDCVDMDLFGNVEVVGGVFVVDDNEIEFVVGN